MPNDNTPQEQPPVEHTGEVLPAVREPEQEGLVTLESLAQRMDGDFVENVAHILESARRASIAMTEPDDWVLFKRVDVGTGEERSTAFLQDVGCQRLEDLWRIEVKPPRGEKDFRKERISVPASEDFAWTFVGDGVCHLTHRTVYGIEGVRRSDEDFVKYKKGIQREVEVRKAAFANLHGGIVRRLTGLGAVSTRLLQEVWDVQGTGKKAAQCPKGKGYGSKSERLGEDKNLDYGPAPMCPKCGKTMVLRQGQRGPFWGCPAYQTCGQKPIDAKPVGTKPPAEEQHREPGDEGPEPQGGKQQPEPAQELGRMKYKLQEKLAAVKQPWAQDALKEVLAAKDAQSLTDLGITIDDRLKQGGSK